MREHHVADRRAVGGQAAADVEGGRHDARRRRAREVDDLVAVERGQRARLAQRLPEAVEDRLREHRDRRRRQVAVAERQHARAQVEAARVVGRDEAQLRQRVQAAPRRGARNPGPMADLRDRHPPPLVRQREQHRQTARQRGHEVGIVAVIRDRVREQRVGIGQRGAAPRWRSVAGVRCTAVDCLRDPRMAALLPQWLKTA